MSSQMSMIQAAANCKDSERVQRTLDQAIALKQITAFRAMKIGYWVAKAEAGDAMAWQEIEWWCGLSPTEERFHSGNDFCDLEGI